MTVSGTVDMSWISFDDEVTGNPMGMGSNVSFAGSGELDNGWGVKLAVDATNALAYSSANVTVTVPGLGAVLISQGLSGTGIDAMDDNTPTAWEDLTNRSRGIGPLVVLPRIDVPEGHI